SIICSPMTSLKTSIKTITYLSDIGCLEIQGASLQSYDSMRYELGVDAGYTFTYSEDQALTPYFKLAYVYDDSNNDNDVNGDSIDNGTEGSAVRVGLGTQFSFTKNFSAYTDANYLGGGDVDQDWSANVGVKYTW
ncbi:autotransporter outer membrane beta-barrel domain-containing protein, partial [Escherichia coli]